MMQLYMLKINEMIEYTIQGAKQMADGTQSQSKMMYDIATTINELNEMAQKLEKCSANFKIKDIQINFENVGENITEDIEETINDLESECSDLSVQILQEVAITDESSMDI